MEPPDPPMEERMECEEERDMRLEVMVSAGASVRMRRSEAPAAFKGAAVKAAVNHSSAHCRNVLGSGLLGWVWRGGAGGPSYRLQALHGL